MIVVDMLLCVCACVVLMMMIFVLLTLFSIDDSFELLIGSVLSTNHMICTRYALHARAFNKYNFISSSKTMSSTNDDLLDERKQRKLAQMSRRDEERKLNLQNKQDERKLITSTNVGRQYFEQEYPQMKNQIEDLLQQLLLNNNQNSHTNNTTNQLTIQDLADRLQKLEKFITEHVEILCSRDIANAQSTKSIV